MTTFRTYQTRAGDRWDLIAHAEYANSYAYERIIQANPMYRDVLSLPGGVSLKIPVVEDAAPALTAEQLPPWRR